MSLSPRPLLARSPRPPPIVIVGNPASRRVAHFANALVESGHAEPRVIAWIDLAREGPRALDRLPDEPLRVRVDSFGEDFEVERAFLRRGYDGARRLARPATLELAEVEALRFEPGRVVAPRQVHEGFVAVLADLEGAVAARAASRLLTPAWAIREMFDKRAASRALAQLGIPVPRALPAPGTARELRERLREAGVPAAWVKLACGSSASCLALWELREPSDVLVTTMERTAAGLFNSKRVRRYARPGDIEHLVDFLLAEGAHVEANVDKATVRDRWVDCRVVAIAGEGERVVVRASRYPMTNLHLGASRSDMSSLAGRCPPEVLARALDSCRRARTHYGALQLGVDVAFTRGFGEHVVLEVNAFGDFVHGSTLGKDGVYAAEIRAAAREP